MKNLFYLIILILGFTGCVGGGTSTDLLIDTGNSALAEHLAVSEPKDSAFFQLNENLFDFGFVKEKKVKNIVLLFDVENLGKTPLVIFDGDVSCSCLSVEYPEKPVLYGEKQQLKVNINTKGQKGSFNKVIYWISNATNDVVLLRIKGVID